MCAHTMATAPKCKVCGSAHWAGTPHAFEAGPEKPARAAAVTPAVNPVAAPTPAPDERDAMISALRAEVAGLKAEVERLRADAEVTEKRRAANRERMQRTRART